MTELTLSGAAWAAHRIQRKAGSWEKQGIGGLMAQDQADPPSTGWHELSHLSPLPSDYPPARLMDSGSAAAAK